MAVKGGDDLAPLRHTIEDLSNENEILQRSQPLVVLYGCFHLSEICDDKHLQKAVALGPRPPVREKTMG